MTWQQIQIWKKQRAFYTTFPKDRRNEEIMGDLFRGRFYLFWSGDATEEPIK